MPPGISCESLEVTVQVQSMLVTGSNCGSLPPSRVRHTALGQEANMLAGPRNARCGIGILTPK